MEEYTKTICDKCNSVLYVESEVKNLGTMGLDTTITPALFIESILNEIRHAISGMRKKAGYKIEDRIILCCDAAEILNMDFIRKDVLAYAIFPYIGKGCDVEESVYGIKLGIKKYPK